MTPNSSDPVSKLIFELSKLPGIGEKTATRLAYYVLKQDETYAAALADALVAAKKKVGLCSVCFTFTDTDPCRICNDASRDRAMISVVERPSDMNSIELSGTYKGVYHVLHGALSPLDGIGPDELKIRELMDRLRAPVAPVREVLLAMNPSVEGDATSLYLTRLIRPLGVRVTQLAHGIPMGGQLEYTDRQTIGKAIENRMEMR
ncbi:MAG: recombination protein RecR [Bdellovibrionales bacterium]|nr:recombination protein RecR [Bdellovibrionales bacterium]